MPKDKDVIKNEAKSKKDIIKKIDDIDTIEYENSNIPKPLNEAFEKIVAKNPKGFIGCGG